MSLKQAVCVLALFHLFIGVTTAEEKKPRSEKEIREELEKAKKRVEELEKELASVLPAEDVKPMRLPDEKFSVGEVYEMFDQRGLGAAVKVLEVIDEKSALIQIEVGTAVYPTKFLMMMPTKGVADGQYFQDAIKSYWKVTTTKKVAGKTVFVMEPIKK